MGISGLLQFIKDAGEPVNVKKYRGQTVAVDTYCWLHKGAFSCAEKLAKGEATDQYVWYCMKFVDMLLSFSVKPILVFDGRNLPSKKEVEKSRRERRETNLQRGRQLLREGKLSEARDCFTRCVNITPSMARSLIKAARTRGVDCLVAPYEADAQLAFLTKSGLAQAVITEDSDLLAFGCRKVILKMDKQGNGLEIDQSNLGRCRSLGNVFTEDKFRYMCILSGCDYLASLHGIGLGKACKLLRLAKDPDILKVIRKMGQYLKMSLLVPDSYLQGFVRANNTFLYQLVFDPVQRKVVPLNPYPEHMDPCTLSYAGLHLGDDTGLQMALGNLDLHTLEKLEDFSPDSPAQSGQSRSHSWNHSSASGRSIWSRGFTAASTPSTASPHRPPPTRGQQRLVNTAGLRLPCRELQLKRPRDDSSVSDQDVLQLYSSTHKRSRSDQDLDRSSCSRQPRPRNRFATLLQRRNQEAPEGPEAPGAPGAPEGHQATRSRFFSSSTPPPTEQVSEDLQWSSSEGPDAPSVETPSPPVSAFSSPPDPCTSPLGSSPPGAGSSLPGADSSPPDPCTSPLGSSLPGADSSLPGADSSLPGADSSPPDPCTSPLGSSPPGAGSSPPGPGSSPPPGAGCSSLGLRLFHWSSSTPPSCSIAALKQFQYKDSPKPVQSSGDSSSNERKWEDADVQPESPLSQDSAYFSQSQPHPPSFHKEEPPPHRGSHQEDQMNPELSPSLGSKGPGLSKPKSRRGGQAERGQKLGPARVSGLRKRPSHKENSPGVQATISSLWENFSFHKDSQKMTPCKKGETFSLAGDDEPVS